MIERDNEKDEKRDGCLERHNAFSLRDDFSQLTATASCVKKTLFQKILALQVMT